MSLDNFELIFFTIDIFFGRVYTINIYVQLQMGNSISC